MADTHTLPQPQNEVTEFLISEFIFSSLEVDFLSDCIHNPLPPSATVDADTLLSDYILSLLVNDLAKTLLFDQISSHSSPASSPSNPLEATANTLSDQTSASSTSASPTQSVVSNPNPNNPNLVDVSPKSSDSDSPPSNPPPVASAVDTFISYTLQKSVSSTSSASPSQVGVSNPNPNLKPLDVTTAAVTHTLTSGGSVRNRKKTTPPESSNSDSSHSDSPHSRDYPPISNSGVLSQGVFDERTFEIFEEPVYHKHDVENPPDLKKPLLSKGEKTTTTKMEKYAKWNSSFFVLTPLIACVVAVIEWESSGTILNKIVKCFMVLSVVINAVVCWGSCYFLYGGSKAKLQKMVRFVEMIYTNNLFLSYVQGVDLLLSTLIHRIPGVFASVELCLIKAYIVFVIKFLGTKKMVEDACGFTTIVTLPICGMLLFERNWEVGVVCFFLLVTNIAVWLEGEMMYKFIGQKEEQEGEEQKHEHGA